MCVFGGRGGGGASYLCLSVCALLDRGFLVYVNVVCLSKDLFSWQFMIR